MRVFAQNLLRPQANHPQRVIDDLRSLGLAARQVEFRYRHVEYVIDPVEGVERGVGILEHGLALAPVEHQFLSRHPVQVAALPQDLARGRLDEVENQAGKGGLAAARLPGDRRNHRLVVVQGKGEIIERYRLMAPPQTSAEDFGKVPYFE